MSYKTEISNSDDVIDSRDVITRIDDLETERQDLVDALEEAKTANEKLVTEETEQAVEQAEDALDEWDTDYKNELDTLLELREEGENCSGDWHHGETLIRESYWEDYVQQLCEDIGDVPRTLPSYIVIDWDATARNIAVDYSIISFDGVDYFIRSC